MKTSLVVLVAGASFLSASAKSPEVASSDRWETLRAINWVENPTNHGRPGRHGELGPYQFRPATWRMHTERPFVQAVQRAAADEVAVKHYDWIKSSLERNAVEPTAFNIALAWNCGVSAVLSGRAPDVSYRYAKRVTNLVDTLKQRSQQRDADLAQQNVWPEVVEPSGAPRFNLEELESQASEQATEGFRVFTGGHRFVLAAG